MFFDLFNCNSRLINSKHTGTLTWSRTNAACKFRKIICRVQYLVSFFPIFLIDSIIEFRNDIAKRTSMMAKGNAAVHATACLLVELFIRIALFKFLEIL